MQDKDVRNTAIYLYDEAEILDFTGPYEVFTASNRESGSKLFKVYTVTQTGSTVTASGGLRIVPEYSIFECPKPDIILIPGGAGRRFEMNNTVVLEWIKEQFPSIELLLSVCTGAFITANTGLLNGLKATTHHRSYDEFEKTFPDIELVRNVKYIDNGRTILSGGISSGINMTLYAISRLYGKDLANRVSGRMEFDYIIN
jgi:transcriptional regulator GlxA family with amidase domain